MLSVAAAAGGCSLPLASLMENDTASLAEHTGAIPRVAGLARPAESDLTYARAVAAEAVARPGKDVSAPWENPRTGARGTVTPLASAYQDGGFLCRDFLASYVVAAGDGWLQGQACQSAEGGWQVRRMSPWRRS